MTDYRAPLEGTPPTWQTTEPTVRTVTPETAPTTIPTPPSRPQRRGILGWLRALMKWLAVAVLAYASLVASLVVAYRWIDPPASTLILAQRATGTAITQHWVPLARISPHLVRAVIMSEDARFCSHGGVDWREIEEAYERSQDGSIRGGSTISMQVAKNLFLWPSKSYLRKALEIPITYAMEAAWSKPRILEIYLNIAEWGPGIFGAEAAANHHFKRAAARLNESESALLAVALPNPIVRDAGAPGSGTQRLADTIRTRMRQATPYVTCIPGAR